ncbi:MAG: hypothetical protein GY941_10770 [Planctomycetes bacterium]|nr:hypothetical protein [Planctomycetota bacterium]
MQYGKLPHNEPDHIILNGEGTNRRDARLLYNVMCSARGTNPPFIDVLAMRGYDVTTIKFSVSKLTTGE